MSKIKIEEILKKHNCFPFKAHSYSDMLNAIKEIVELAIDKCAENATAITFADTATKIHKSITKVKTMIDYE